MLKEIRVNILVQFSILLFMVITVLWITIYLRGLTEGVENNIYTLSYPFLSLLGGIIGIISAKKWGGLKSLFGKSIYFFSFGLLAQFFGQLLYSYYIYIENIQVPYPSLGDVGYFGSVIFYIFAVLTLGRVIAVRMSLQKIGDGLKAFLLPCILLVASYFFFLQGYTFDWSQPTKIILDFGYPFGQALYVSLAIVVLFLSRSTLGGLMKNPIRFLILALLVQYACDFMFLYQSSRGTWYVGGVNDFLYSVSYFLMTLALVYILSMFKRIQET